MATQHPDHACEAFWHKGGAYIPIGEEAKESYRNFFELGIGEVMWDWEGKLVDESVLERFVAKNYEFFKKYPIGKDFFLTFRLPNPKVQTEFRMARALMNIATSASMAKRIGWHTPPLFEVVVPMTENAEELIEIQKAFKEIVSLKHPLNRFDTSLLNHIMIVPLFEQADTIINADKILEKYVKLHKKIFKENPKYIRPFVARSDPALNSGILPTVMAIKIALSRFKKFEKKFKIPMYPVIGCGTLPFRGGLNPIAPSRFINEYKGVQTVTIQSAFRYDFPKAKVIKAIKKLDVELPKGEIVEITKTEEQELTDAIRPFENYYRKTIEGLAPEINQVASHIPRRRERVQHTGLFGYSRGIGKVSLPRAISFTCALYSLGIPPEIIGTGRGLAQARKDGTLKLIEKNYINLKHDLYFAGKFLYRDGLVGFAEKSKAWRDVLTDVEEIEKYLGRPLGPKYKNEIEHQRVSAKIHRAIKRGHKLGVLIENCACLRHSMG